MTWSVMQYNVKKKLLWRAAHKINAQNRTAGAFVHEYKFQTSIALNIIQACQVTL